MRDEDGILTERATLLDEIRSDVERLSTAMDQDGAITDALRSSTAALADKLDALADLMRMRY
ncbi:MULTISPECIES: hypothetical protein [Komagataeibacter]|mgnify:FL=1|uniref:Uncharacterized protein n=1 Tax=Komagataeibacter saccharivorans TaxID=265959 RepID=A0A347WEV9_9PROT|nr:hypothetical protein [Komagataeibacter saccharivorans]AXY23402.1 hypothetical protein CD178_02655 [Komagataeibacter saccharivorans]MBL7237745.1 hypothetical protein [Novacetimonas hansenii]PYD50301.1 hypothetical protein CFR79_10190 [Komagataeibacter saccharivorans]QBL92699.1 hypothetical protein KSAC_04530 [Komagataeibacter saccharivorans]